MQPSGGLSIILIMKKHFECKSRRGGCIWSLVKLGIVLVILLAVIVYFTMGYIADYALGKVTKGTGIDAGVSSLMVSPFSQEISVGGFYITNPPGYSPNNAFAFKEAYISTDLSPSKLLGEKLITINEIRIIGLDMSVELKTGTGLSALLSAPKSNLTEIADILKKKAGMDKAKDDQAAETAAPAEKDESEPMKFIVKKIVFADSKARGGLNEKSVEIALPSFNIENIGVRENGLTGTELAMKITEVLAKRATLDVVTALAKDGINLGTDAAGKGADEVQKGVGEALKGIFGN